LKVTTDPFSYSKQLPQAFFNLGWNQLRCLGVSLFAIGAANVTKAKQHREKAEDCFAAVSSASDPVEPTGL
jgi:hypothetical protein